MSHFLFEICKKIDQADIVDVLVTINGKKQTVFWGQNVEIKTAEKPDPPTKGVGLKFDFGLDNGLTRF
ncbi:MAG: hypothetical protein MJ134_02025 [Lachnospiraceae bacterium]|nr:hypothetical protein [Lachnospiraceae bacterium]